MSPVPALQPDKPQIASFVSALFRHATPGAYIAWRAFAHRAKGPHRTLLIDSVRVDAPDLLERAEMAAAKAANSAEPAAFYVPIATFEEAGTAKSVHLVDGLSISLECDHDAQNAVAKLLSVLGQSTLIVESGGLWVDAGGVERPKLHVHYRLARPARDNASRMLLAEARSLARQLVKSDATCDPIVHPLRVPGGWHRKNYAAPRPVVIADCRPDTEIDLEAAVLALRTAVPEPEGRSDATTKVPEELRGEDDDIAAALAVIPNQDVSWDRWNKLMMAAFAASEGHAVDAFLTWSEKSDKHDSGETEDRWDHLRMYPPARIGMGTLVHEARKAKPDWTSPSKRAAAAATALKHFDPSVAAQATHARNVNTLMEDEAALRFAEEYRGRLRFCHDHGAWFEWTGTHWRKESTGLAFHWARELARRMAQGEDARTQVTFGKAAFAGSIERFARADRAFAVTAEVWDRDPMLLGTPGGTVDLTTGILRSAKSAEGITKLTATAPTEAANCPLWLRFLDDATGGDAALIQFLQQWAGYALTGDTREHALAFLFGDGGNGKTVFVNVLIGIAAAYAVTAAMDTFIASHGDRHSTDLAMLRGARLVTASETEEGRQWAEARIKALTGGDPITARFMRRDFFTFRPSFKLTIIGNHKPGLKSVDAAARRRFNLIPFTRKPAVPDRQLEEKLKAEWPGILRWMIDGCLDWQRNGLTRPAVVIEATDEYFVEQDTFGLWLAERCVRSLFAKTTSAELFGSWSAFARLNNEQPGTARGFAQAMQKHGFVSNNHVLGANGSKSRGFSGVALRLNPPAAEWSGTHGTLWDASPQ